MKTVEIVRLLAGDGAVVELRAVGDQTASGYYDDFDQLARDLAFLESAGFPGIYLTLNPVNPALLSRRANRLKMRLSRSDQTTADGDILCRRWLPVDIDPVRPSGISATDEEKEAARIKGTNITAFLAERGFPDPVVADSGNGTHLLYRIYLPNTNASTELVHRCLSVLSALFSDETAQVDTAVANPARIWKLYGTLSRKGDNTAERPHRRSAILSVPAEIQPVPTSDLEHLAGLLPDEAPAPQRLITFRRAKTDLDTWLSRHRIPVVSEKPWEGGVLYRLGRCPFSEDHTDGAYAIRFPDGKIHLGCHHQRCGAGTNRWQEVADIPVLRPSREVQPDPPAARPAGDPVNTPVISPERSRAEAILKSDPAGFILSVFGRSHVGDDGLARSLLASAASRLVLNTKGIHVLVSGASGKGKSDGMRTMLRLLPPDQSLKGRFSDKALYYNQELSPGSILLLDDMVLSEDLQSVLKESTTSFTEPILHRTVDKSRQPVTLSLPERCIWWIANVHTGGDDQVLNRMLTVWVDDSPDQDAAVYQRKLEHEARFPAVDADGDEEVVREIWRRLTAEGPVPVRVPYAGRIRMKNTTNRRNVDLVLDLIKAHAVLHRYSRTVEEHPTGPVIVAGRDDFAFAARLYGDLHGSCGSQDAKLTKDESRLVDLIRELSCTEFTYRELMSWTGWSYYKAQRVMRGDHEGERTGRSGLLEKIGGISEMMQSRTIIQANGRESRRSCRVFLVDPDHLTSGLGNGLIWLEEDEDPGRQDPGSGSGSDVSGSCAVVSAQDEVFDTGPDDGEMVGIGEIRSADPVLNGDLQAERRQVVEAVFRQGRPLIPGSGAQDDSGDLNSGHDGPDGRFIADPADSSRADPDRSAPAQDGGRGIVLSAIDPGDYVRLEIRERRPCSCCGKSHTEFRERMTRDRMNDPPRPNRMLCTECYQATVIRRSRSITTLPGSIEVSGMKRWSVPLGRCHVCGGGAIEWYDPVGHVGLCEMCYGREKGIVS